MHAASLLLRRITIGALLTAIAGTGFAQSVNTNYMPGTDFSAFKSYRWVAVDGSKSVTTSTVDIGTLSIDFYDPAKKQLLWRGSASETVHNSGTPEKKQERIDKAMAKLLKKFPPPAK
jgi:hypothetical protein